MKKNLPMATRNSDLLASKVEGNAPKTEMLRGIPDGPAIFLMLSGAVFITMLVLGALYLLTVGVMNLDVIMAPAPQP